MDEYKKLLKEYISLKSVSTDPEMKGEMKKTADWLVAYFKKNGFDAKTIEKKGLNPVVFSCLEVDPKFKTVLVYGHYDVQPAQIEDGWRDDPFELVEREGRLFARGVVDNKGQNLIHIFTVVKLLKEGKLKYNVKFIIEGDEETGGVDLIAELMEENRELLKADRVVVSDGELVVGKPCIEASFRGGFNLTLKYTVAKTNVHSGLYGGAVPNAAYELSSFLSKLFTNENKVSFDSFYTNVDEISQGVLDEKKVLADFGQKEMLENAGFKVLKTEGNSYDFFTQTGLRPTLQITGLKSGYIGIGYSNIVPAQAEARINFRLVASQDWKNVLDAFKKFVKENTPDYVDYDIEYEGTHDPVKLDTNTEYFSKLKTMLGEIYEDKVFNHNVGGAIPFIGKVKELFGVDTASIGLCNEDCNMHGSDENFKIDLIEKGLSFSERLFTSGI